MRCGEFFTENNSCSDILIQTLFPFTASVEFPLAGNVRLLCMETTTTAMCFLNHTFQLRLLLQQALKGTSTLLVTVFGIASLILDLHYPGLLSHSPEA